MRTERSKYGDELSTIPASSLAAEIAAIQEQTQYILDIGTDPRKAMNFSMKRSGGIARRAHDVKVYITANILAHNGDLDGVREYSAELREIKPDALIISDPNYMIKEVCPEIERHISTQANNTNYGTYRFWYEKSAVSARRWLRSRNPCQYSDDLEIETFIHGAMCISYSGRCLLSNYSTGRDANQGACTHPCRWKYAVVEENARRIPAGPRMSGTLYFQIP